MTVTMRREEARAKAELSQAIVKFS